MIGKIALVLFYLLSPAAVLWACNKWKVLNKIGPVLILYFLGIIVANLNLIPADCAGLQDTISTIAIPLALPMMLYSCNFKKFSVKTSLKITIIGIVAVAVAALVGFFAFRGGIGEEAPIVGAAVMGKCTGGTPNLAALKVMLNMENSTFIILNSFDMVICFFYLVMLMTVGIKWGRKWLGRGIYTTDTEQTQSKLSAHRLRVKANTARTSDQLGDALFELSSPRAGGYPARTESRCDRLYLQFSDVGRRKGYIVFRFGLVHYFASSEASFLGGELPLVVYCT